MKQKEWAAKSESHQITRVGQAFLEGSWQGHAESLRRRLQLTSVILLGRSKKHPNWQNQHFLLFPYKTTGNKYWVCFSFPSKSPQMCQAVLQIQTWKQETEILSLAVFLNLLAFKCRSEGASDVRSGCFAASASSALVCMGWVSPPRVGDQICLNKPRYFQPSSGT